MGFNKSQRVASKEQRFKFGGKEEQEWRVLDFGARMYDASIGRWNVPDALSDEQTSWTVYRYGFSNPINFVDEDGNIEWPVRGKYLHRMHNHTRVSYTHYKRAMQSLGHVAQTYNYAYRQIGATNSLSSTQLDAYNRGDLAVVNSDFFRIRNVGSSPHIGVDFKANFGSDLYSLDDGTVVATGFSNSTGKFIVVEYPNGDRVRFMHLNTIGVSKGDTVYEGQVIGATGNSGAYYSKKRGKKVNYPAHLHVDAVNKDGELVNPLTRGYGAVNNKQFFEWFEGDYRKLRDWKQGLNNGLIKTYNQSDYTYDEWREIIIGIGIN